LLRPVHCETHEKKTVDFDGLVLKPQTISNLLCASSHEDTTYAVYLHSEQGPRWF